jgi:hypothetical protein
MTEAIRWLFTFSSPYHLFWFLLSMTWLVATLTLRNQRWMPLYGSMGHMVTVIDAVIMLTVVGPSQVYSIHCVWFNALMALAHYFILEARALRDDNGS